MKAEKYKVDKPLLAMETESLEFEKQMILQPKLNGIRATWYPEHDAFITRGKLALKSVDHIVNELHERRLADIRWDGEIFTWAVEYFQDLNGMIRRQYSDERSEILEFHIFDIMDEGRTTIDRLAIIHDEITKEGKLKIVPHVLASTEEDCKKFYKEMLEVGYEGIIARNPYTMYGHSKRVGNDIWKYKPEYDDEATLVSLNPSEQPLNKDTFGSMNLIMDDGRKVKCSGIPQKLRKEIFDRFTKGERGTRVTIIYGDVSKDNIPIFPRAKAIRWDL